MKELPREIGVKMDMRERLDLKKKYALLPDEEIINMLLEDRSGYVEGAYDFLLSEAKARGIEDMLEKARKGVELGEETPVSQSQDSPEAFVQMMVINNESDYSFIKSLLESSGIVHYFHGLSLKGLELPASLMVGEPDTEKVMDLLKDFKPNASIILW